MSPILPLTKCTRKTLGYLTSTYKCNDEAITKSTLLRQAQQGDGNVEEEWLKLKQRFLNPMKSKGSLVF